MLPHHLWGLHKEGSIPLTVLEASENESVAVFTGIDIGARGKLKKPLNQTVTSLITPRCNIEL